MSEPRRECPDEGACHHNCGSGACWRVFNAGPLSAYCRTHDTEAWLPEHVKAEEDLRKTIHVLLPTILGGDGDKAVCGVRISHKPDRRVVAETPTQLVVKHHAGCEKCFFRILRTFQEQDPSAEVNPYEWTRWPWEAASSGSS